MSYVMDASSLFNLLFMNSEVAVKNVIDKPFILDITSCEIGSILTKVNDGHISGLNSENLKVLTKEIESVIRRISCIKLSSDRISGIMAISTSIGLTFYDACYVFYAKYKGISLLTDDKKMYNCAKK